MIDKIVCVKCGRLPKEYKVSPFTETFYLIDVAELYKSSICPECKGKLEVRMNAFEMEFRSKQRRRKLEWLGVDNK